MAALVAPVAATILQLALSRSREHEADAAGARLLGDGTALARALAKLDWGARTAPMAVDPAQAAKYIVNPLTGRHVSFVTVFSTHPPVQDASPDSPRGHGRTDHSWRARPALRRSPWRAE